MDNIIFISIIKLRLPLQLGIFNFNDKLKQYKINLKNIQRMDENRLPKKKKLKYNPEGRRNIGRPLTRWEDDFREEGTGQGA